MVDLGLRLADIEGLEREPAAATKTTPDHPARAARRRTAPTAEEIDILLNERVELNAMTSDALIAMIETQAQGLRARKRWFLTRTCWRRPIAPSTAAKNCGKKFEEMEEEFDDEADDVEIPKGLKKRVRAILDQAPRPALGRRGPDRARQQRRSSACARTRRRRKKKSGDFTGAGEDDDDEA